MLSFETFEQLTEAIEKETIKGMSAGYWFLDQILDDYLELDLEREPPQLPFHQTDIQSDESFQKSFKKASIPDDFWEYVKRRAEMLTEPIDRTIETPGISEVYWDAVESHNNDGGYNILQFLEDAVS